MRCTVARPARGAADDQWVTVEPVGMTRWMLLAAATLLAPNVACAQSADPAGPPALCTDRPSKATSACTVPMGMFQVEADLVNWTHDNHDGMRTDTLLYASPLLKYGVTGSTDIRRRSRPMRQSAPAIPLGRA